LSTRGHQRLAFRTSLNRERFAENEDTERLNSQAGGFIARPVE